MTTSLKTIAHTPQELAEAIARVTWIGLGVNLVLTVAKLLAGLIGSSQAVVADAAHSFSDMVTDVAVLLGAPHWTKPPDKCHPHGHARIECLITVFIGAALAVVAVGLMYESLSTLQEVHLRPPGLEALIAALISIGGKETLYRWTIAVGGRIRSSAVIANAWHHRSDALSSIPAAAAVGGAILLPSCRFLDHVGAVVVAIFILQAAWKISGNALKRLSDAGAPTETIEQIKRIALATPDVRLVHNVRTRYLGMGVAVDLHVKVDPHMTVRRGHEIAENATARLRELGPDIVDVVVHLEPYDPAK